jgi:RNA polymerase sigma-70 factor (ECF subfamily)
LNVRLGDLSDAEIVERVRAGEVDAFAVLLARHRDRMVRYATHMLGDPDEAEDVVQDGFVRAYRAIGRGVRPERVDGWLFRIIVNRCRTEAVRQKRRVRLVVADESAVARAASPGSAVTEGWLEAVDRAIRQLDPRQREAFLLHHVEGMGYLEIAEVTGAGESALKMRVKRACERLRALLKGWDHD